MTTPPAISPTKRAVTSIRPRLSLSVANKTIAVSKWIEHIEQIPPYIKDSQAHTKQVYRGYMQLTEVKFELCIRVKTKLSFQNYMHVKMW